MQRKRRSLIKTPAAAIAAATIVPSGQAAPAGSSAELIQRPIPGTGELLPVIGLGTARRYASATTEAELAPLRETLRAFADAGGRLIDTAPSYGDAERLVGQLIAKLEARDRLFLSSKVGATGRPQGLEQIERSFSRLRPHRIDLMSVHNLQDTATQLATLRDLRDAKLVRYLGITTSNARQYAELEQVIRSETLDFIQVDYALDNRAAADRLLPLARERGIGVLVNLPFGRGRLFQAVHGRPLPDWTAEFDCASWACFFLKYIVAHEAVTCVIPGMARPEYVADNLSAAKGRLPDESMRRRMQAFIEAL